MPSFPVRKTQNLRKGRQSITGARYFLTCCLRRPARDLVLPDVSRMVRKSFETIEKDGNWSILAATLMPDHLHILFTLGQPLSIGRVIAKFKMLSKAAGIEWQNDFYEHRLRPDDAASAFARYIFMNPYRAGLVSRNEVWPHWIMSGDDAIFDFIPLLEEGRYPPTEWLDQDEGLDIEVMGKD